MSSSRGHLWASYRTMCHLPGNSPLSFPVIRGLASSLLNDMFNKDGEDMREIGRCLIKNGLELEVGN